MPSQKNKTKHNKPIRPKKRRQTIKRRRTLDFDVRRSPSAIASGEYFKRRGGGEKLGVVIYESPLRPKFPVSRVMLVEDSQRGSFQNFEQYLNNIFYDSEEYLYALKENQNNVKIPKKMMWYNIDIENPVYIAPVEI